MNKKNKKIRLSFLHLAVFLSVCFINLLFFSAFRSYFFLITGILFTLIAPLSFYTAWRLTDYIDGTITAQQETVRQGDKANVLFTLVNRSFFCALRGTWFLTVGNAFYQTFNDERLLLSVPPHGKKQLRMTVSLTDLGQAAFICKECFVTDPLGIFKVYTDCTMGCRIFVLPRPKESLQKELPDAHTGAAQLSESVQKGNDHSEVSDIRAYAPGDRPRDIHWKLSARHEELMVKERISLSGSEHILLLDLPKDRQNAGKLLNEGYRKVKAMLDEHMTVRVLIWNAPLSAFESYSCLREEDLDAAFCEIFRTDLLSHYSDLLRQYMKTCYPMLDSYLCVTQKEETIQLEICING